MQRDYAASITELYDNVASTLSDLFEPKSLERSQCPGAPVPETCGSLGMLRDGEHCDQRMAFYRKREFFKIKCGGLSKVF